MSQEYTIAAVSPQTRDYGEGAKAKRVYYVKLEDIEPKPGVQAFELHKLQTSKPPEAGHRLDVKTFQEGEFGGKPFVKIIQDYSPSGPGQGGGSFGRGGRDDATGQSIERQVAAKAAAEIVAGHPSPHGPVGDVANFEALFDAIIAKIQGVPGQLPLNGGGGEVPADTEGLSPAPAGVDESIPF